MNIFENLIGTLKLGFKFLNRKDSPSNKATVRDVVTANVNQAGRDINYGVQQADHLSDVEIRVLTGLYRLYREGNGRPVRWSTVDAHRELGITDGTYVGMLQDSQYVTLDGEHYAITNAAIRYMDARVSQNRPKLDFQDGMSVSGGAGGNHVRFQIENRGINTATNIRWQITSNEFTSELHNVRQNLPQGGVSNQIEYEYTNTPLYQQPLNNIQIRFEYSDEDGFNFSSSRNLTQQQKATGDYRLNAGKGDGYREG